MDHPSTTYGTGLNGTGPYATPDYLPVTGVTLFADESTSLMWQNVEQGAIGDCWLMASLAEVAARDPGVIQSMFIPVQTDGSGNVTAWAVRFYHNGVADYVTVDNELPVDGTVFDNIGTGVLWAALAEKAYVEENTEGWLASNNPGSNGYQAVNYITGPYAGTDRVLSALTGSSATGTSSISVSNLATAWQNGQLIVLGTPDFGNSPAVINGAYIVSNHVYAVVDYSAANQQFTLFNPWGVNGNSEPLPNGTTVFCAGTVPTAGSWTAAFSYSTIGGSGRDLPASLGKSPGLAAALSPSGGSAPMVPLSPPAAPGQAPTWIEQPGFAPAMVGQADHTDATFSAPDSHRQDGLSAEVLEAIDDLAPHLLAGDLLFFPS
jgi:hypothetical protein